MKSEDVKVVYVLDAFHLLERKLGDERIDKMSVKQILELMSDTSAVLKGEITPSEFEKKWKL